MQETNFRCILKHHKDKLLFILSHLLPNTLCDCFIIRQFIIKSCTLSISRIFELNYIKGWKYRVSLCSMLSVRTLVPHHHCQKTYCINPSCSIATKYSFWHTKNANGLLQLTSWFHYFHYRLTIKLKFWKWENNEVHLFSVSLLQCNYS